MQEMNIILNASGMNEKQNCQAITGTAAREGQISALKRIVTYFASFMVCSIFYVGIASLFLRQSLEVIIKAIGLASFLVCLTTILVAGVKLRIENKRRQDIICGLESNLGLRIQSRIRMLRDYQKELYRLSAVIVKWVAKETSD